MKFISSSFTTDTASLCIFDLCNLKHKLDDDYDWWCFPDNELLEVNQGNVVFVDLGIDGLFNIEIIDKVIEPDVISYMNVTSGKVFLGAAEEVTGDGLEPECIRGGCFIDLNPNNYLISIKKNGKTSKFHLKRVNVR